MKSSYKLLPLLVTLLLTGCGSMVPVGETSERFHPEEPNDPLVFETTWDFRSLGFFGSLNDATPSSNFKTFCNAQQSSTIVDSLSAENVEIKSINTEANKSSRRIIIGNEKSSGELNFKFNVDVKYIKLCVSTYFEVDSNNAPYDIDMNSALYANEDNNLVDLSIEEAIPQVKSQKITFETDVNELKLYTKEKGEKVILLGLIIGYSEPLSIE